MRGLAAKPHLRNYAGAASLSAGYALIAVIWLPLLLLFLLIIRFRLAHLLPHAALMADPPCPNPECDFSVFWPAGRLARLGDFVSLYTPEKFQLWRQQVLLPSVQRLDWFYPPPSLLPVAAISYLPFNAAYFVWSAGFAAGGALLLRWAGLAWSVVVVGLLSPAALWTVEMGQFEIMSDALLVAGLMSAAGRPATAGAWLGLLVLKPQTGLLGPVALLARGELKALAAFAAVVAGILALTTVLFGMGVWRAYLAHGLATSHMSLSLAQPVGLKRGVSVFWMLRSFGAGLPVCYAGQGIATLAAICLAWRLWRQPAADQLDRMALTVFLTLLATPFGYVDDMVAWSVALAALAQRRGWRISLPDALLWLWPALCPMVFDATGLLLTPVVVAAAVTIVSWRPHTANLTAAA